MVTIDYTHVFTSTLSFACAHKTAKMFFYVTYISLCLLLLTYVNLF